MIERSDVLAVEPRGVLTPRELQVLELAAVGLTNRQVAERLSLSAHAVKFHLAATYRKLGVANRTQAAAVLLLSSRRTFDSA